MTDDEPTVQITCTACATTTRVPLSEVADAVERHNEQLHDGESIAEVDPAVADSLADLVADDLGLLDGPE
ncbi:MAG: hypothetical protein ABEI80_01400 [Haloplanus sp.]